MASSIETHPQRNQIVEGLLSGRSYREIGESVTPRVSAMALHRYKAKRIGPTLDGAGVLSKALQTLAQANGQDIVPLDPKSVTQAALAADPLLSRRPVEAVPRTQALIPFTQALIPSRAATCPRCIHALHLKVFGISKCSFR